MSFALENIPPLNNANNQFYHSLGSAAKTNEVIWSQTPDTYAIVKWISLSTVGRWSLRLEIGGSVIYSANVDVLAPVVLNFNDNPIIFDVSAGNFEITTINAVAGAFNISFCYEILG